jgi:hypothetical protein
MLFTGSSAVPAWKCDCLMVETFSPLVSVSFFS